MSVVVQCELLSVHRSGLYYQPRPVDAGTLALQRRIDELYTACPFYGVRKITAQLRSEGRLVNHKAVARHMQAMGLRAIYPGPNLSRCAPQYIALFQDTPVQISMDGKGRALDNIFTERLWRTVKYEEVYLKDYASPREARSGLSAYLDFYNYRRLHQALDYQTPASIYFRKGDQSTDQFPILLS